MSKFLTGKSLEGKLTDIIWEAKRYVVLISPYIKLDNHVKKIFEKIKSTHEVHIILVFGKNNGYKQKSFNKNDYEYFKEFKNISILYSKNLHAKHYCNEKEGLITSLNLYDYSMIHNIEYGVHFTKNIINTSERLFDDTEKFTNKLIFEKSDTVFVKRPQYKKKNFGLTKSFQSSKVLFDISEEFFQGKIYEKMRLKDFDVDELMDFDNQFIEKPQRKLEKNKSHKKGLTNKQVSQNSGFCIRSGIPIPFNPEQPMSKESWQIWNEYRNHDHPEKYCHFSGEPSEGKTTISKPILFKNWNKAKKIYEFKTPKSKGL